MVTLQMPSGTLGHLCASFANDDHAGDLDLYDQGYRPEGVYSL